MKELMDLFIGVKDRKGYFASCARIATAASCAMAGSILKVDEVRICVEVAIVGCNGVTKWGALRRCEIQTRTSPEMITNAIVSETKLRLIILIIL